ncbi:MlaA family lipoprotein [Thorsellia anophelis]|uniref:Phospholipid-binding lipoprotein MlaA n=1 Tax=Thorsellia anophelis DSM 18579 TaxID=1123402 RepID=A0A1I0EKL2_9GAMM|nr:MlaA family lipoprotein [Thorsellia anophelis]SET45845.1 phospholipid-binding lipoprotein MlaA [Thorsellia anophelis DSM 18579]
MNIKSILLSGLFILTGCASHDPQTGERNDPFEGFNRVMFTFNFDVLDPYVLRPVAVVWKDYVPEPAKEGTSNFLYNLSEPAHMVNNLLQGEITASAKSFNRFMLNTIFGLAGLIDVAAMANDELKRPDPQRFGTTLGSYGVPSGPYIVLPFYGSFTITKEGGNYADTLYPMLNAVSSGWWLVGTSMVSAIDGRAKLIEQEGLLKTSSDPYITVREAYFQRNEFLINRGQVVAPTNTQDMKAIEAELDALD